LARSAVLVLTAAVLAVATPVLAGGIDIQKIRLKGAQHIKDLKFFQETGLIASRNTAIEMQIDGFERSLISYREAKHTERNLALKGTLSAYERFNPEFKAIAEIFRDLVDKYQKQYNEKNAEPFADTNTKEKVIATVEVGKQDESRGLAAYSNRNYSYAAHLYLRSLRHYHQAFDLRKWPQLAKLPPQGKTKPAKSKKATVP
jgi:hypothetical protein